MIFFLILLLPNQEGVSLIEFVNHSQQTIEADVNGHKCQIQAKSSQRLFVKPGTYECIWLKSKATCALRHGDITVIDIGKDNKVVKQEIEKPKPPEPKPFTLPLNTSLMKVIVPKGSTRLWIDGQIKILTEKTEYSYLTPVLSPDQTYYYELAVETPVGIKKKTVTINANKTILVNFNE